MSAIELNEKELSTITGGTTSNSNQEYLLIIKDYNCPKEEIIKLIKEMLNIGYKEAIEMVDSLPKTVQEHMSDSEANYWKNRLVSNNIIVEIEKQ